MKSTLQARMLQYLFYSLMHLCIILYINIILHTRSKGSEREPAVKRGVEYLIGTQTEKGLWDEQRYTATGFPRVFYLRYHGYSKFFPLWALARYRNLRSTNSRVVGVGM